MQPGINGELVFDSTLEARVSAHLLNKVGLAAVAGVIDPYVSPELSAFDFLTALARGEHKDGQ